MKEKPFKAGDVVKCRHLPNESGLALGGNYVVAACAMLGGHWVVRLAAPHDKPLGREQGDAQWFMAQRFVRT